MILLYTIYSNNLKKNSYNFERKLVYAVKAIFTQDIHFNTYYFAGNSANHLYLGNRAKPLTLLRLDNSLKNPDSIAINLSSVAYDSIGIGKILIDSPDLYVVNGMRHSVFRGNTANWELSRSGAKPPFFQDFVPLSSSSYIYRYVNKDKNNSIKKENLGEKPINNDNLLKKQVDGLFCTDGFLEYNAFLKQLVYVYLYRNEVLVADTNLRLVRTLNTIDPIAKAQFKVSKINSSNSMVVTSPILLVNGNASSWKQYLFVHSKLMGKHEDDQLFKNSVVIDVYDLTKSKYLYSFYLPKHNGLPITQLKVIGNSIYTISGHFITCYTIDYFN